MIAAALLAAVLLAPPAAALTPAREAEISAAASEWTSWRNRAQRMIAAYPAAVERAGMSRALLDKQLAEVRAMTASVENEQAVVADMALEAVRAAEPPSAARLAKENAVRAVHEVRALALYGNLVPRILDEAIRDAQGRNEGRRYAGPEWAVALTWDEVVEYGHLQIARAGFTRAQFWDIEDKAAASLGLPPKKR